METLLYLLYMALGRAPMIPLDEGLRPTWLFGNTVYEGCDRGGLYEQAQFAEEYGSPLCSGRHWRMPERRGHLHRMYHAGLSRQVHALYEPAAGLSVVFRCGSDLWARHPRLEAYHAIIAK